ncbi:hypothetical protein [Erythrobacter rubeus]|uniref:Uncharacterized protein n=1 Tax=Erythrobacter rubeus TaxID=2760803 RepID=A0ABR8KWW9_9SPHN|nr:hypothetical protein [Erythrobacter rubeus]MBD2842711.1 hypothetical protein [Erythrobacter rubeus]
MAEIPFPTSANIVSMRLELDERQQVNRSEWTGRRKVTTVPGAQRWFAQFSTHTIHDPAARKDWRAFLIALQGEANTFRLPVASVQHAGANPLIRSAGATGGGIIPVEGLPVSSAFLDAGDYLTVPLPSGHQRLVMITADVVSNSSGHANIQVRPFLNEVPAAGAVVESVNPFALMALASSRNGWTQSRGGLEFEIQVEEAL